ncbi:hypothetical protein BLOT_013338 [Blomia tropicalis]|nr:hypothetical protein BLOT_013338 [Blomia tropicalis]
MIIIYIVRSIYLSIFQCNGTAIYRLLSLKTVYCKITLVLTSLSDCNCRQVPDYNSTILGLIANQTRYKCMINMTTK